MESIRSQLFPHTCSIQSGNKTPQATGQELIAICLKGVKYCVINTGTLYSNFTTASKDYFNVIKMEDETNLKISCNQTV